MRKVKFRYNPETCRYEPYKLEGRELGNSMAIFCGLALTMAFGVYYAFALQFGTLEEILLEKTNENLKAEWQILEERINTSSTALRELIDKDDNNYRIILDTKPLPASIRDAGIGGSEKYPVQELQDYPHLVENYSNLLALKHKLEVEVQSYDELKRLLSAKMTMWNSRPAIQPVNNKELEKLHTTFGPRFHPIFKEYMDHKGLDFTASQGTPVYATGDGRVTKVYYSDSYGKVIYIDHRYDYETRYAHLSKFAVKPGEKVKRGQIIGYVGNTGNSVSPHLHYEVLYKGNHINPINFFQRDLSNKEYERLIEIGSRDNAILD